MTFIIELRGYFLKLTAHISTVTKPPNRQMANWNSSPLPNKLRQLLYDFPKGELGFPKNSWLKLIVAAINTS
jgi:hypothetical protein